MKQTILGSTGEIGTLLATYLTAYTKDIRLVSRNPKKVNEGDELFKADLLDPKQVEKAVEGSSIVYLTVGLPYSAKVWERDWFKVMHNTIEACKIHKAKLIFFDNIYMYDCKHLNLMNEETPNKPCSRKGQVRKYIADYLMSEVTKGNIEALIARSADFLSSRNSILIETVYNYLIKGKPANWLMADNKFHNFTYSRDAALATAFLGNTSEAYNQIWHLPTDATPLTGKDWIELFAKKINKPAKYRVMTPFMLNLVSLFVPILRETKEMAYQYDRHYIFDSKKIENKFGLKPTNILQAIDEVISDLNKMQKTK